MWRAEKADKNKQPYEWLRLPNTVEFVDYIQKTLNAGIIPVLAVKGRYGGTCAHWQIALAYAKYLSPEFHVWSNKVLKERFEEEADPELAIDRGHDRAKEPYRKKGMSEDF